jgi:glycerophosphoryl diester phosphodiesterase
MTAIKTPEIIAHRGWASCFPENTLESVEAAFEAGAGYVEFDVQLSADGVPVLLHDATLDRTAGASACVHDLPWGTLARYTVGEAARLGSAFPGVRLPSLAQAMALLARWSDRQAFVEVKTESVERFGIDIVLARCLDDMVPAMGQCIVTSYSEALLERVRDATGLPIAWVLKTRDEESLARARKLGPEYLFCNVDKLPPEGPLAAGPWRWAIYEITDPETALALAARGAAMIETMAVGEMLEDPRLRRVRAVG